MSYDRLSGPWRSATCEHNVLRVFGTSISQYEQDFYFTSCAHFASWTSGISLGLLFSNSAAGKRQPTPQAKLKGGSMKSKAARMMSGRLKRRGQSVHYRVRATATTRKPVIGVLTSRGAATRRAERMWLASWLYEPPRSTRRLVSPPVSQELPSVGAPL